MFTGHSQPRNYLRRTVVVAGAVGILAYLVTSAVEGERGLLAAAQLKRENALKTAQLAEIQVRRDYIDRRVQGLDPAHLDLDMLGEAARRVLFYSEDGEIVIKGSPPALPKP